MRFGFTRSRGLAAGAAAMLGVSALALGGCSAQGAGGGSGDALNVVATTTQVQDFTREIGGDAIRLTGLLKPGASAHHFDPSPKDLSALRKADVLVINGAQLEEFLDSAIDASGFDGKIVDASTGVMIDGKSAAELAKEKGVEHDHDHEGEAGHDHDHADHGHEHGDHGHADHGHEHADHGHEHGDHGHDHAHEGEAGHDHDHADHDHAADEHDHDHDHGGLNPHLWTSPANAKGMVSAIEKGLAKAAPKHRAEFAKNAKAYTKKLDTLDSWIAKQMERVPENERQFTSAHNALAYYLDAYDIEFIGAVIPSMEDNAEPSAAELNDLIQKVKEHRVKAIFSETTINPKLSQAVAKESGAKMVDTPIYADSLDKDGPAASYIGATVANTKTMLKAWGYKPESVPSSLM